LKLYGLVGFGHWIDFFLAISPCRGKRTRHEQRRGKECERKLQKLQNVPRLKVQGSGGGTLEAEMKGIPRVVVLSSAEKSISNRLGECLQSA